MPDNEYIPRHPEDPNIEKADWVEPDELEEIEDEEPESGELDENGIPWL